MLSILREDGLGDNEWDLKTGGRDINNLCSADETTLKTESSKNLQALVVKVKKQSEKWD